MSSTLPLFGFFFWNSSLLFLLAFTSVGIIFTNFYWNFIQHYYLKKKLEDFGQKFSFFNRFTAEPTPPL